MCSPLDPLSCVDAIAGGVGTAVEDAATRAVTSGLAAITDQLHLAIKALAVTLAGWIVVPSTPVCDTSHSGWMQTCDEDVSPAAMLRGWVLPLTVLVTVIGVMWQGVVMTISRRGEPLLVIVKGLAAVVLWGAVGLVGTQLALRAGDAYAFWVLKRAIFGDSLNPTEDVGEALASMAAHTSYLGVIALLLLQVPFLLVTVAQIILMVFREGAVVILAGQLQLAAAGGLTRFTSGWLPRVAGWMLALLAYKPAAATVYAVAFALLGDGGRNIVMGLAVMVMAVVALPALLRLFTWTVGSVGSSHGAGLGLLASATAAGLHGAATIRGLGGYGPGEHARYLDSHGPSSGSPSGGSYSGLGPTGRIMPPPPGPIGTASLATSSPATSSSTGSSGSSGMSVAGAAGAGATGAAAGAAAGAALAVQQKVDEARERIQRSAGAAGDAMHGE